MASSTRSSLCVLCHENKAFFTCCRCREDYCEDHINNHEQSPVKQMDDYLNDHHQLQQMINNYIKEPRQHPLIEQIDQWERKSIGEIQQAASDARSQILNVINDHIIKIRKSLENLTETLEQSTECFLQQGGDVLTKLRSDLISPNTIELRKDDDDNIAFISKLVVIIAKPDDLFERSAGNVRIEDHGQIIVHGQWSDHSSVRGKGEYSSGEHRFRFQIEELDPDKWAFFGIVSKGAPIKAISITTPTAYGLAGQNGLCLNGIYQNNNQNDYESDMEMNDTLELFIDCDHRLIRLTNERTSNSHALNIDSDKCPFPWQILLGLCCAAGDRIRILPCTYKQ